MTVAPEAGESDERPESDLLDSHHLDRAALLAALAALDNGRLDMPAADLTVALTAIALLRVWSRWLRGFADSSVPYLLDQFIRRAGRVLDGPEVVAELEPRPLDMILEMAGYTQALERVPWLGHRRLRFRLRGY
jgi:hypothetical protein